VGGDIKRPEKIKDVPPVYPAIAKAARVAGMVIVEAIIARDGSVKNAKVIRSVPMLDQAALDAVNQWRYTPTMLNNQPVEVIMTVNVTFAIN
jgi:protein TonB